MVFSRYQALRTSPKKAKDESREVNRHGIDRAARLGIHSKKDNGNWSLSGNRSVTVGLSAEMGRSVALQPCADRGRDTQLCPELPVVCREGRLCGRSIADNIQSLRWAACVL